jgi:DNA repair exonuclease SbcCD nuclease subunit
MRDFRFLHTADIHLDSPMRGLEADPDAPIKLVREASRAAFRNLIDTAINERVAFLLIAGDLYDGDWQDWRTGLFFVEQVSRLAAAGIPLIMVAGNHDAASVITRHLRLPEHVTLFPHDRGGRLLLEEYGVAVHGQSFATRAVTEDLSRNYPNPVPDLFNIGLLHTSLTGRPGHENYAPTTVDVLIAKGYDYWALGHVHAREIIHEDPWIVFPGNLQGRQVRESGPKGATLVTVRDRRVATLDHRILDVFRWCPIDVSVSGERDFDGAMDRIGRALSTSLEAAEGRPIAACVKLTGATLLHEQFLAEAERLRQAVLAEARQYGVDTVWIQSVVIDTASMANLESLRSRPDVVGRLSKLLDELIKEGGTELLGEYPDRLLHRSPEMEFPAEHPLGKGRTALLKRARELVLANLAGEL